MGMHFRHGHLIRHSDAFDASLAGLNPRGAEIFFHWQTDGSKAWHHEWKLPEVGFSLGWYNLDRPDVLGHVFISTLYFQKYIRPSENRWQFSYKIAPGLALTPMYFHPENNPKNVLVSVPLSFVMEGNLLAHYRLGEHWRLHSGVSFTHYSNGAWRKPNRGTNIPALVIGTAFSPNPSAFQKQPFIPFEYDRGLQYDLVGSVSLKSPHEQNPDRVFAATFTALGSKRLSTKSGVYAAFDLIYSEAIPAVVNDPEANPYRLGVAIGHELYISKVSFLSQVGTYLYRPVKVDKPVYLRWGVRYYATKTFFLSCMLRTHFGRADLIEWGIGYRISKKTS